MSVPDGILLLAWTLATGVWWILIPARALWNGRRLVALSALPYEKPERWPSVSVLVPARNEEQTLADAVRRLCEVDYPKLEIILVDDRSTDRTGEIVQRLARQDARIRALRIENLPAGWLGKVHALHRGVEISRGEWLLFTDADVHLSPGVLKQAVAYCLRRKKGFLALLPRFRDTTHLVGATQTAFATLLLSLLDTERNSDPDSPVAIGIGAFNLARRSHVESGEGLAWLRMEVADDLGLARMMKQRGAAIDLLSGRDSIEVDWYPTLVSMFDGVMQRLILGARYYLSLYLLQCLFVGFCVVAPAGLAFTLATYTSLAWLGLAVYGIPSLMLKLGMQNLAIQRALLWSLPIGFFLLAWGMLRSVVTCIRCGGIHWRNRVYPLRELRASQRVKMNPFTGRIADWR